MTFRLSERELVDDVGRRLRKALAGKSIKAVQAAAGGVSHPTGSNYHKGDLPSVFVPFFALLKSIGPDAADVMEPVLGSGANAARLSAMARGLKELGEHVDAISRANREGRNSLRAFLGFGPAARPGVAAEPSGMGGDVGGRAGHEARRLDTARRSLDVAGTGHLGDHLACWRECSGRASLESLLDMARSAPGRRTSIVSSDGADFVFDELTPAFRLHVAERERRIGRPTTDVFDRDYAEACDVNTRRVIDSGEPAVDDVEAVVRVEPGVSLGLRYRRLVLPYVDGARRFAVCASEPLAGAA